MRWTDEQQKAIDSRNGTILVSAAAGSGKTAVLVERIIQRLLDSENPCDADGLLIVTFTKAATAQMKQKIGEAISKRLAENPQDNRLLRQQMLLPFSKICTIDSFCNDIVRENFHLLGVNPDFKILDNSELILLRGEAASGVVEKFYSENSCEFNELVELLFKGSDDSEIISTILRIYDFSIAYPFPQDWLDEVENRFIDEESGKKWLEVIFEHVKTAVEYCKTVAEETLSIIQNDEPIYSAYSDAFISDIAKINEISGAIESGEWDKIRAAVLKFSAIKFNSAPRGYESNYKDFAKNRRNIYKEILTKNISSYMCASLEEHKEDLEYLAPIIKKLIQAVRLFGEEFTSLKEKKNGYDFSDINHLALKLLVCKNENGEVEKTELAKNISSKFSEILVDEFQDINAAQNYLFSAISKDESNLFMVGDVKQSIYRFRQAMPEIFLNRRNSMQKYVDNNYPAQISLDRNFRSRSGVIDSVNFIFNQIMSKKVGDVDYSQGEALVTGADYIDTNVADAEIHILETDKNSENDKNTQQAEYIASLIKSMLESGLRIKDGENERLATYRDFCILLRSSKDKAQIYADELAKQNIPGHSEDNNGFFNVPEVTTILSLMKILDNPLQDVPLISVMLSPIFGFTADELAELRINERNANIYTCILKSKAAGNQKCADFLSELERLRMYCSTCISSELIQRLLEETGYLAIVGAMSNGKQRRANLRLLCDYATKYDSFGNNSISGFVRFIDKLSADGQNLSQASQLSESANVVRIMTIHKSKGLEFPICILANCEKTFNLDDAKKNLALHSELGIGFKRRDIETFRQFDTLTHCGVRLAIEQSVKSEELRLLYVALTRAKERIITVMSFDNSRKKLSSISSNLSTKEQLSPFAVLNASSYADWILMATIRHPDSHIFREMAGIDSTYNINAAFKLKAVVSSYKEKNKEENEQTQECIESEELMEKIHERLNYKYEYSELNEIVAKRAASHLTEKGIDKEFFATSRPDFMNIDGLTPAQKGTATHKFMQYADYEKAHENSKAECTRLVEEGYLSEQEGQAVDLKKIDIFFDGFLAERIFASDCVMREKKFTINFSVAELYETLSKFSDETVLVQGIADCVFVENGKLIIVDYKTDHVKTSEILAQRYSRQLLIYRRALSECLDMEVGETLIYSFALNEEIEIKQSNPSLEKNCCNSTNPD